SNLQQGFELGNLRLERLLDRERILELLRQTDPNTPGKRGTSHPPACEHGRRSSAGPGARHGEGRGEKGGGSAAGGGEEEDDTVPEEVIKELEARAADLEGRAWEKARSLESEISARLEERSRREGRMRREGATSRDAVLQRQTEVAQAEGRLSQTVLDYLTLRHNMLCAQRVSREEADALEGLKHRRAREVELAVLATSREKEKTREEVDRASRNAKECLRNQIRLREEEACMLEEQREEEGRLYQDRVEALEVELRRWRERYLGLRRRFSLETEGFQRDAEEIGRRFDRIRKGARGGRGAVAQGGGRGA
ncbi:unnamed protein product, partial [Discosporangium mesarthrocarpum]